MSCEDVAWFVYFYSFRWYRSNENYSFILPEILNETSGVTGVTM